MAQLNLQIPRYGKDFIPISKVDASLMKRETEKELKLLCTTKRKNIRREQINTTNVSVSGQQEPTGPGLRITCVILVPD